MNKKKYKVVERSVAGQSAQIAIKTTLSEGQTAECNILMYMEACCFVT